MIDITIFLFVISYVLLDVIGSVFYVGALLLSFIVLKKLFHMDENKWNAFFKYGKGTGFYFMILFPYLVMLVVLFLISKSWFDFIDFEHSVLGSLSVVLFLSLFVVFAFPKLKRLVDDKVKESNRAAS